MLDMEYGWAGRKAPTEAQHTIGLTPIRCRSTYSPLATLRQYASIALNAKIRRSRALCRIGGILSEIGMFRQSFILTWRLSRDQQTLMR